MTPPSPALQVRADTTAPPDSGSELQWYVGLLRGSLAQAPKELPRPFGALPRTAVKPVVVTPRSGRHPHLMQWLLQVDDDLAAVGESQRHHAARALGIHIGIGGVVDAITAALDGKQQLFGVVHEFEVGHYNLRMLKAPQILVRTLVLAASAAALFGCGQRGPLYLPTGPAAGQRATLPETLTPSRGSGATQVPAPAASAPR